MATTSQLQIVPFPTTEEIALTLLQWMFANIGIPSDYNVGSIIRTYSEALGSVNEIEGITAQAEAIQALVYSAYAAFNISPLPATGAVGTITFSTLSSAPLPSGQSVLIPAGTIVQTTSAIQFATTANALLVSGTSSINASIQAVTLGSTSNVVANTIIQIITGLSYPLSVINSAPTAGGANAETPSQTLTRFLAYVDSLGLCSPIAVASAVIGQSYLEETVLYSTCYDDQTEVLTKDNGWKLFKDLIPYEKVATLNPDTHELEYQEPEAYHKYWYKGQLITIQNKVLDLAVTPDHKMYVLPADSSGKESTWRFVEAKNIKHTQSIKRDCNWAGQEQEFYEFGEYKIPMDLWLEFLGYFISEGSAGAYEGTVKTTTYNKIGSKNRKEGWIHRSASIRKKVGSKYTEYSIQISQTKNGNKDKMRECLNKLPFNFGEYEAGFIIKIKALYEELTSLGKSNNKFLPNYVKNLSSRQLKILLDALTLGDGMVRDDQGKTEWKYFTCSKKLADDVQELVLKIGLASSIKIDDRRGREVNIKGRGITGHTNYIGYIVCIHRYTLTPTMLNAIDSMEYKGNVYCITVPNHIIYVRRNGKTCWSGNCYEPWVTEVQNNETPVAGYIVYIDNGTAVPASANLISVVTTYLSNGTINNIPIGFRPAGVPFTVEAVNPVNCSVQITGTSINSALASSIQTAITQSLSAYFASIGFNTTVELTQITAAVANASFGQLTSLSVSLYNGSSPVNSIAATGPGQRIISTSNVVVIN